MKRGFIAAWMLAGCALLAGCSSSQYAHMLIEQDTTYGRLNEAVLGSADQLVKSKCISAARRYAMADKTQIDVWLMQPAGQARGSVVLLHGLCDSKVTYMRLGRALAEKGFTAVLVDLRAHGRSTGRYVAYGALEKHDVQHVMDRLLAEKLAAEPIYAVGASLGASVAIMYAAQEPRVKGVLAMAPFKDMGSICRRFISRLAPLMEDDEFAKVLARAGQIGGFDPADASTIKAVTKLRCPLLLVHGRLDTVVPFTDSQDLFESAVTAKELELSPLDGHPCVMFGREAKIIEAVERLAGGKLSGPQPVSRPASQPATQP